MAATNEERIKSMINRMRYLGSEVTKAVEKLQKTEETLSMGAIKDKLDYVRSQFILAQELNTDIEAGASAAQRSESAYFKDKEWHPIQESYELCIGLLESQLNLGYKSVEERSLPNPIMSSTQMESHTSHSHQADTTLKLPKLEIPHFDGTYDSWQNFKDLFTTSVDQNATLSNVVKMQHLKSLVKGDAANVISTMQITEANYLLAWNALKERYDNKRAQITYHFNKLAAIPVVGINSLSKLKTMRDTIQVSLGSLQLLGYETQAWGPILVHQIIQKFTVELRKEWEKTLQGTTEYPQFATLEKFLTEQINILENMDLQKDTEKPESSTTKKPKSTLNTTVTVERRKCVYCDKDHAIYSCTAFQALNVQQRQKVVKDKRLCGNCLAQKHFCKDCKSTGRCRTCNKRHHTLLHRDFPPRENRNSHKEKKNDSKQSKSQEDKNSSDSEGANSSTNTHVAIPGGTEVMLATVLVKVCTPTGHTAVVRALIDSGSESSFVSESLTQTLKMKKVKINVKINGLQGEKTASPKYAVSFEISGAKTETPKYPVYAYVLQTITSYRPRTFQPQAFPELQDLVLADPAPRDARKIDLLLGSDVIGQFLESGVIHLRNSNLIAQASTLGWILSGPISDNPKRTVTNLHAALDLPDLLQRFWELEESLGKPPNSEEDEYCEQLFLSTTTRDESGRYCVHLPIKPDRSVNELGDSRHIAVAAWRSEAARLNKMENVREEYDKFMLEYLELGHMTEIPADEIGAEKYVHLPHHGVVREDSKTTKLRVVFNASSKTKGGVTLNDILCTGPKLQNETADVISNWRIHVYVYKADVSKMYRQIEVHPSFRHLQCIVWQPKGEDQEKFYQLNTVTYGLRPAPFLANRVIKAVIEDHGSEYPLAIETLDKCTYVDDTIFGADTEQEAKEKREQVEQALRRGCLELRKWSSNSKDLLPDAEGQDEFYIEPGENSTSKVLGLVWSAATDEFSFKVSDIDNEVLTKRTMLSNIAKLFDPLGWLSPFVVRAKVLMQSLWLIKLGWDDQNLPEETQTEWLELCEEMQLIKQLKIPRFIGPGPKPAKVKLVGFADASKRAYSAVAYIYVEYEYGDRKSNLLRAKTKVAPLKTQSIPRLELCATVELTKLIKTVKDTWLGRIDEIVCYTDSQIVLDWFSKHASSWHTFVANRVSLVQTTLPEVKWNHVPSKRNPADLNSRGLHVCDLLESNLWWSGPDLEDIAQSSLTKEEETEKQLEVEKEACHLITNLHETTTVQQLPEYLTRHSSWMKLVRILALWYKYLSILKERIQTQTPRRAKHELWAKHHFRIQLEVNKVPWNTYVITREHVIQAQNHIYKKVQEHGFKQEMSRLNRDLPVSKGSPLYQLVPFLDEQGVMRQKGRLVHSQLPYSQKHPVILPQSRVTDMLISHFHLRTLHGGLQLTLAQIRERYVIIHCRNRVKWLIKKCVTCARIRGELMTQQMSALPAARSSQSRPFSHTGVDYIGPFQMKNGSYKCKNSHKIWIAIFVCFSTRAIHLELCNDYSTNTFLAAFKCFTARRGLPSDLYSDQATNFKGANAEMKRAFKAIMQDPDVCNTLASQQVQWHFIPPSAGHWGGLWESGVKSFKHHFRRVLGSLIPTRDELHTILCQIEACLNSRPLSQLRDDPTEEPAVTPGHSLIGASLQSVPEPSILEEDEKLLTRWQTTTRIVQNFWKRWRTDYLHTLQNRPKWAEEQENLKAGDIVLLRHPDHPPCDWGMAKVIQVMPSKDQLVRQVKIQTQKTKLVRPITALCKLPVE